MPVGYRCDVAVASPRASWADQVSWGRPALFGKALFRISHKIFVYWDVDFGVFLVTGNLGAARVRRASLESLPPEDVAPKLACGSVDAPKARSPAGSAPRPEVLFYGLDRGVAGPSPP